MSDEFNPEHLKQEVKEVAEETVAASEGIAGALRQGAAEAGETADRLLPKVGKLMSKGIYSTCYYGSFGVVFTALTIARLLPKDGAVIHGIEDGADAARHAAEETEATTAGMPAAESAGIQA
jgi:hypothetical protein